MTGPGEPGKGDPSDADSARARLGRHAAPDDGTGPVPSAGSASSKRGRHAGPQSGEVPAQPTAADHPAAPGGPGAAPVDPTPDPDEPADGVAVPGSTPLENDPAADGVPAAGPEPAAGDSLAEGDARADGDANAAVPADGDADSAATPAPTERRRHAAAGSSFRLPGWMIAVAGLIVLGLISWLVVALLSGGDEPETGRATSTSTSATASASPTPTPVDAASLPQVLCMGSSYVMVQTGQSTEQLLADPKAAEAKFPGSKLSTIPPGCVAKSDVRDEVVLALGPYTSIEEACTAAKALQGVQYKAYAGSADAGLTETTCP